MRVVVRRASSGLHGARAREEARRDEGLPAVCQAHTEPLHVPGPAAAAPCGSALSKKAKANDNKVPPAWTDAAAALAVSATRDPQKVVFGPQRGPRDVSAAPGLSPAAFESRTPSRAPSAGSWADLGAPPPGREQWKLGRPRRLGGARGALYRCTGGGAARGSRAAAGVPRPRGRAGHRLAAQHAARRLGPARAACWTRTSLRTAGPIHPLVIDDVPVALVQTTP